MFHIPNFWLGFSLIWLFSLTLHIFPSFGYGSLNHLVLPALTLGISMSAVTARLTRASLLEVLGQEYILAARARGLDEYTVLFRHALKNALLPVVTFAGMQLGYLSWGSSNSGDNILLARHRKAPCRLDLCKGLLYGSGMCPFYRGALFSLQPCGGYSVCTA